MAMMLVFIMTSMLVSPILAASTNNGGNKKNDSVKKSPATRADILKSVKISDGREEFSAADLEQMRSSLLELIDANQLIATLLPTGKNGDKSGFQIKTSDFDEARAEIRQMSEKDLTTFKKGLNPSRMHEKLANSRTV